ncbi:MAG: Acyl-CoA dehydrogenase [uncultured Rubrobacteraceae bacterium]|uniref:Acyl-CoA dehydrogenase n=1 Tax=uncultured Rubrobacteraceae bacterium TaxID=349277 RepID=A0A6J4QHY6_9ACTN|nr:MAG: Acyl-CoA dehydrogenase [uncultured Rubrobacteraceae bacterium]
MIKTETHENLRRGVREVCANFPGEYWRELDAKREYPEEFVRAITEAGYLSALIPEEYGGMGLDLSAARTILEEVNKSGANANPAQMYKMGNVLRHCSEAQKEEYLPKVASGELRLQAFGVTEPEASTDTIQLKTTAVRSGDRYIVNGRKICISRVQHSDLMSPRPHLAAGGGREVLPRPLGLPHRPMRGGGQRPDPRAAPGDDEQ